MSTKISLLILIILTLTIPATTVRADIPSVLSITRRTDSGNTLIDVLVRHADPTTNHYIMQINLDLDGTIQTFKDLPKATTTQYTFTLNIGSANPKTIKAQAVCNLHGPGSYYTEGAAVTTTSGGVPGYPTEAVGVGILLAVVAALVFGRRR